MLQRLKEQQRPGTQLPHEICPGLILGRKQQFWTAAAQERKYRAITDTCEITNLSSGAGIAARGSRRLLGHPHPLAHSSPATLVPLQLLDNQPGRRQMMAQAFRACSSCRRARECGLLVSVWPSSAYCGYLQNEPADERSLSFSLSALRDR